MGFPLREAKKYKLITNDEFQQYVQSWFQTPDKIKYILLMGPIRNGRFITALTTPVAKESFITKTKYSRILLDRFKNSFLENYLYLKKVFQNVLKAKILCFLFHIY